MYIDEWEWDEENEAELARHALTPRRVLQVARTKPRFRRNRKRRTATHMMVGPDLGGTIWVVCIAPAGGGEGSWRAITGWLGEEADKEWYERST